MSMRYFEIIENTEQDKKLKQWSDQIKKQRADLKKTAEKKKQ